MSEFIFDDYIMAGHLKPFYEFGSLLDHVDLTYNPYGFSTNPIDDIETSYRIAKMVSRVHCKILERKAPNK